MKTTHRTSPLDGGNYCFHLSGTVDTELATTSRVALALVATNTVPETTLASVPVTNMPSFSFEFPHLTISNAPVLQLCLFPDLDENGAWNEGELRQLRPFTLAGHETTVDAVFDGLSGDYDHDGVDNAEEFLHQCDPLTKDTDGDGLTDREEIDGSIVGMAGFDPLVRCDYPEDTSDADAWGTGWNPVRFVGVNASGFPLNVGYPDEADGNVDVLLMVDSSRYAVLSWEDGSGPGAENNWPSRG